MNLNKQLQDLAAEEERLRKELEEQEQKIQSDPSKVPSGLATISEVQEESKAHKSGKQINKFSVQGGFDPVFYSP